MKRYFWNVMTVREQGRCPVRAILRALEAIFGKGFTGPARMKHGTGHRFRDFHVETPLIHGLRRCVIMSVLVRWRPTREFVPLR